MKIADGELRQILLHDCKLPALTVRELVADARQSKQSLLSISLNSKLVTDVQIAKAQAKRLGVPFIDLVETAVTNTALHTLPHQLAARYKVICFDTTATSVKIAMADPRDQQARKALRDYCGKTVRRYLATERGLTSAMRAYRKQSPAPLPLSTRDLLATILYQADRSNSRDIHFEPAGDELIVKRRAGKQLKTLATLPISRYRGLISWCKVQINSDAAETERAHHGRFALPINGRVHTIMVSILPTMNGEKMVLRLVPPTESIPTLHDLGFNEQQASDIKKMIKDGRGLIIIAGGNGSGRTTTLASLAALTTQQPHSSVMTIEDPITYQISGATQLEVTQELSQDDLVTDVIAQMPSAVMTHDLGNSHTATQLVDFSLGQHLVISGAYGTSLAGVLSKLMNYAMAPALMAASPRLIAVQHQIPALCSRCRIKFTPSGPLKKVLQDQFEFKNLANLYRGGSGCDDCQHGTNGTSLAIEWLPVSTQLQQLLASKADKKSIENYLAEHSDYRMQLGRLASKGLISIDEATRRAA